MGAAKLIYPEEKGFYGRYAPADGSAHSALILCIDDDANGFLAKGALRWANEMQVNALAVSPHQKEGGYHRFALEQVENAVKYLKEQGNQRVGKIGRAHV